MTVILADYNDMISIDLHEGETRDSGSAREEGGFRVNWLTQRTYRSTQGDGQPSSQERRLIDKSGVCQLKLCLRREINLIPTKAEAEPTAPIGTQVGVLQESGSGHSNKNSCEKRGKLSLISKRPSLRKISDFISFKDEPEGVVEKKNENRGQKERVEGAQKQQCAPGRKRCIRISSRRQCLGEINKN